MRLALFILLLTFSARATTYYVRTDGNNSNTGTANTAGGAWAQIRWASSNVVAGDIVRVQAGTYTERVFETTDGSSGSRITYVADGEVIVRGGFQLSGDYITIAGFSVTHSNALDTYNYEGIQVSSSTVGTWIMGNNVFQIDEACIDFGASCHNSVVFGNWVDQPSAGAGPAFTNDSNHCIRFGASGTNIWVAYNRMNITPDYISMGGQWLYCLNNVAGPNTNAVIPHCDMFQMDSGASDLLIEANYHFQNYEPDGHFNQFDAGTVDRVIMRFNAAVTSKGLFNFYGVDTARFYNNTLASNNLTSQTFQINVAAASTDWIGWNNIFYYSNPGASGAIWAGSPTAYYFNQAYGNPSYSAGTGDLTGDPLFAAILADNVTLQSGSPARATGTNVTLANGAGSASATLTVDDAYGLFPGDSITVGGTSAVIQSRDSSTQVTLTTAISWSDNAAVLLRGITDRGAYPYTLGSNITATISNLGSDYTVAVDRAGDCRGVLFYVDSIPQWPPDTSAPYTLSASGTVTARALQLYASTNLWAAATPVEAAAAPTPGVRFRGIRLKR